MVVVRALLLLAHGSRREVSNDQVRALAAAVADEVAPSYDRVGCAFLELAAPDIGGAIDAEAVAGVDEVVLLPYFLSAGRHVGEDIPAIVDAARERHPALRLRLLPHLGALEEMPRLIASAVTGEERHRDDGHR